MVAQFSIAHFSEWSMLRKSDDNYCICHMKYENLLQLSISVACKRLHVMVLREVNKTMAVSLYLGGSN